MDLNELRCEIDQIDRELIPLFLRRMNASAQVAEYKREHGMRVLDPARERALLEKISHLSGEEFEEYARTLYATILSLSRSYQYKQLGLDSPLYREITDAKGKEEFAESCWRSNGDNHILGLLKYDISVPVIDPKTGKMLNVKLPVKGHIYDLRKGKYLGYSDKLKVFLIPANGEFFSVMKEKVTKVTLTAPQKVKAGSPVKFSARALTLSGRSAGEVVYHWEFISPSGKEYDRYTGNILSDAKGEMQHQFQSAFNDEKGKWHLKVTCVNSGTKAAVSVTVE